MYICVKARALVCPIVYEGIKSIMFNQWANILLCARARSIYIVTCTYDYTDTYINLHVVGSLF